MRRRLPNIRAPLVIARAKRGRPQRQWTFWIGVAEDFGAIAQLGERLRGTQEVGGSIPPSSTNSPAIGIGRVRLRVLP